MNPWIETISDPMRTNLPDLNAAHLFAGTLVPLGILCIVSLVLTVLWAMGIVEYTWLKHRNDREGVRMR